MSIWTEGKKRFMFQAYKGRRFAKNFEKLKAQNEYRKNQKANESRARLLGSGSTVTRRRRAQVKRLATACYDLHEQVQAPFDPTPRVTPPK